MPRTKSKPAPSSARVVKAASRTTTAEVLTLAEAAAFLRVSEPDLRQLVGGPDFPGRMIGGQWRILKSALQDWLRTPPQPSSKEALLSLAGAWKDDPDIEEIVREAYRKRGRPITEDGE